MNQYLSCVGYGIKQTETTFYLPFRSAFPVPERCRGSAEAGRVAAASEGFPCRFGTNSEGTYKVVCLTLVVEKKITQVPLSPGHQYYSTIKDRCQYFMQSGKRKSLLIKWKLDTGTGTMEFLYLCNVFSHVFIIRYDFFFHTVTAGDDFPKYTNEKHLWTI